MKRILVIALCTAGIVVTSYARDRSCKGAYETVVGTQLKSWHTIYDAYQRFSHCDDGAVAGGFSEAISLQLANHWETMPLLNTLIRKNHPFGRFVLRHLGDETPIDRWEKIKADAQQCPSESKSFCQSVLAMDTANPSINTDAAR